MERRKLRGRIIEKYGTIGAFCDAVGFSRVTASKVLYGKTTPTPKHLMEWCRLLGIEREDIGIFFYPEGLENQTEETA